MTAVMLNHGCHTKSLSTMNPFTTQLKILHNKACIARFRIAIYEAVLQMGFQEEYAERIAHGTMIHNNGGDQHTELELGQIQAYYDEIFLLRQCNSELRAKQTTLQTTNTELSTSKIG
jgi:hypothetical protein